MCLNISEFKEAKGLVHEALLLFGTGPVIKIERLELVGESITSNDHLLLSNDLCFVDVSFGKFFTFGNIYRNKKIWRLLNMTYHCTQPQKRSCKSRRPRHLGQAPLRHLSRLGTHQ